MGRLYAKAIFDDLALKYQEAKQIVNELTIKDEKARKEADEEVAREVKRLRKEHNAHIDFVYPTDTRNAKKALANDLEGSKRL